MPPKDRTKRRVVPNQDRARASIEAILGAAELLLDEEGFERMTTNRIARRAGVNVALVYRYFAGKEAIVGMLIERVARATLDEIRRAIAETADLPLDRALIRLFEALTKTPALPTVHRELFEHMVATKRLDAVNTMRAEGMALFAELLERRRAELRALPDFDAMVFVLMQAIEAVTNAGTFYRPERLSRERVLDALRELVLRGLAPTNDSLMAPKRLARTKRTRRKLE